jgi:hypothetical protein
VHALEAVFTFLLQKCEVLTDVGVTGCDFCPRVANQAGEAEVLSRLYQVTRYRPWRDMIRSLRDKDAEALHEGRDAFDVEIVDYD